MVVILFGTLWKAHVHHPKWSCLADCDQNRFLSFHYSVAERAVECNIVVEANTADLL